MKKLITGMLTLAILTASCGSDDDSSTNTNNSEKATLGLNIQNLEDLGNDFVYEGWLIIDNKPKSTGRFSDPKTSTQEVSKEDLEKATSFILSIEPKNETGQELIDPALTKIIKADFSGNTAQVTTSTVGDYSSISGMFFLRTPTDDAMGVTQNDEAGVWFGTPGTMPPAASLELPILNEDSGWVYEGWAVVNGIPYTTGTFKDPKKADDNASSSDFKGTVNDGPPIPGEDFINNLEDTSFPTTGADLRGATIVVSIEPVPDNDKKPFSLKPLVGMAGMETAPESYPFGENLKSFPTGTITR